MSALCLDVDLKGILAIDDPSPEMLSARERQVVALLSSGLRLKEIAETLCLSPKTVDNARQSAYNKLGIHDRLILALWAHRHGIDVSSPASRRASARRSGGS